MSELTNDKEIAFIGETNFRNQKVRFGIKPLDRRRHMYLIGSTGMGKSELMKNMAIQDMESGRGVCYIDPHGDAVMDLLDFVPEERIKDVIYFNPGDKDWPIAFNVMERVDYDDRGKVTSGLLGVFKKIWPDAWSGRMEYILNNTILALLECQGSTLLGINRMMSSKEYRKEIVAQIKDPIVRGFWVDEFSKYADKFATEATAAIQNKVGQFASNNLIRNIIGQTNSKLDLRTIMDQSKILLVNASRGEIGEDASRLLGALLITKIQLAAMSRVDVSESERPDFFLYVDEFQHFATESFANILSEARKYHLCLIMGHQYITQMEEPVRDAVFGNVGTLVTFRVGAEDAEFLERWYQPDFTMNDIVNLAKYTIYIKLMINGVSGRAFSAATFPPFPRPERTFKEEIIQASREVYTNPKDKVEKETAEWMSTESGASGGRPVGDRPRDGGSDRRDDRPQQPRRDYRDDGGRRDFQGRDDNRGGGRNGGGYGERRESAPIRPDYRDDRSRNDRPRDDRPRDDRPRQDRPQSQPIPPKPIPSQPSQPKIASLSSLQDGAVDFKGRKIQPRDTMEKKEVNLNELRNLLKKSLDKKEE